jgi:outer membrane protein assembly factor BamB
VLVLATLSAACSRSKTSTEWPQFRGPGGWGTSAETDLPEVWGPSGDGVRWRSELPGWGNSSPVVADGRVFLTAAYGDRKDGQRGVLAFDLATGKKLWDTMLYSAPLEKKHGLNTNAAPTPVWDGERLFVYFGAVLAALDREGKVLWQREIDRDYAEYSRYGAASSPIVTEHAVIVVQDQESGRDKDVGWLAAYDKSDGKQLWRTQWNDTCCSYSTPVIAGSGADAEIVFAHSGKIAGYAPPTGERLWQFPYEINQMVSSPSIEGDLIAVAGGAHQVKSTHFLRRLGKGKETRIEVIKSHLRFAPQTSSPVLYQGLYFTVTEQGLLACYRAATGELLWKEKLSHGRNHASLLAGDGKIYIFSGTGEASVVAAEPAAYRLIAANNLGEDLSSATPAIADGCLLVRGRGSLFCIGAKGA